MGGGGTILADNNNNNNNKNSTIGYDYLIRMVFAGDSGVGKSCAMLRFADDVFAPLGPTIGVDFRVVCCEIEGTRVKLQLWDTAGQERFRTITSSYYRGAEAVMLCFSVGSRTSLENAEAYWHNQVLRHSTEGVTVVLMGLKEDLPAEEREVTPDDAAAVAARIGAPLVITSAKEGRSGVSDAIFVAAREALKKKSAVRSITTGAPTIRMVGVGAGEGEQAGTGCMC
jgi:small GTP-binding protein